MKKLSSWLVLAVCGVCPAAEEWIPLFDGESLDGRVKRGGTAEYTVEDGAIVGTSKRNTPNTFLCTPRDYSDFILEYEYLVDPRLNSGVQIRSQCFDKPVGIQWAGQTIEVPAGRVHGYQIEIDPDAERGRWWSAGVYEEAVRGWLYPGILGGEGRDFSRKGAGIFRPGDWNKVRVEAVGDHIRTTLNGTPCADLRDPRVSTGFIGLQVHSIGADRSKEGARVRWRNLRIREVDAPGPNTLTDEERAAGWTLLWDGRTSNGWRGAKSDGFPDGGWTIRDGVLSVNETGGGESTAGGDIITVDKYADFELKVDFRLTPGANSGIKIFVDPELNKGPGSSIGPEFQILDDALHPDAKLGRNGNRTLGSLYDLIPAPGDKTVRPAGEWNHAHIISRGNRVEFRLNGRVTATFERGSDRWREMVAASKYKVWPRFGELEEGHILLQDHGNHVSFRNIRIREL